MVVRYGRLWVRPVVSGSHQHSSLRRIPLAAPVSTKIKIGHGFEGAPLLLYSSPFRGDVRVPPNHFHPIVAGRLPEPSYSQLWSFTVPSSRNVFPISLPLDPHNLRRAGLGFRGLVENLQREGTASYKRNLLIP